MNPFFRTEAKKKARKAAFDAKRNAEKKRTAQAKARVFADRNKQLDRDLGALVAAVAEYVEVQDRWLQAVAKDSLLPGDWVRAYRRMKRVIADVRQTTSPLPKK